MVGEGPRIHFHKSLADVLQRETELLAELDELIALNLGLVVDRVHPAPRAPVARRQHAESGVEANGVLARSDAPGKFPDQKSGRCRDLTVDHGPHITVIAKTNQGDTSWQTTLEPRSSSRGRLAT